MFRVCWMLLLLGVAAWARPAYPQFTVQAAGHSWRCYYAEPSGPGPWPMVLVLHGAGGSGPFYLDECGWAAEAQRSGFLAVAPEGLPLRLDQASHWKTNPRVWNTGQLSVSAGRGAVDDLVFFEKLLDELPARFPVDRRRIYCAGHSNGAGMTFRLASAFSGRLAAVAPFASPCGLLAPTLERRVPTLFVLGTQDPLIPWQGGMSRTPWGDRPMAPITVSLSGWARALGYNGLPRGEDEESQGVRRRTYGRDFQAWFVAGQGHNWPGGRAGLPVGLAGPNGGHLNATREIWRYLAEHALPD